MVGTPLDVDVGVDGEVRTDRCGSCSVRRGTIGDGGAAGARPDRRLVLVIGSTIGSPLDRGGSCDCEESGPCPERMGSGSGLTRGGTRAGADGGATTECGSTAVLAAGLGDRADAGADGSVWLSKGGTAAGGARGCGAATSSTCSSGISGKGPGIS